MNFFASNTMAPQPTFYTFTRGMFCSIRTWSTTFKLQHYFWELGLVFLPPKRALPPNPPPPAASLFTTKSDTSKAFQTTAIPVRNRACVPPLPHCLLKTKLHRHASNTMVPRLTFYMFTRGMFCSIHTHGVPHSSYSTMDKPLKTWKLNQTMENRWCHRKLKKNVAKSRKATENWSTTVEKSMNRIENRRKHVDKLMNAMENWSKTMKTWGRPENG